LSTRHAVVSILLGLTLIVPACSSTARYRLLTFFLDGVPEPGASPQETAPQTEGDEKPADASAAERLASRREVYSHPPYRKHECGRCHNPATGTTFSTQEEGLCQSCHGPGQMPFLHGPVAVKDCLFCHHYHTSTYPKLLLVDVVSTCFRCHKRPDLTEGPHHAQIDSQTCVECHDPHGGDDKFFLRSGEREVGQ